MRRSLLVRFLTIGIVIVVASIAGTAWILTTAVSRRDAVQINHDARTDRRIVAEVRQWAGSQRSWDEAEPLLRKLANESGRRVVLLDDRGAVLADSNPAAPLPDASGVPVDPLAETYADTLSPISTTVAGALRLSTADRATSHATAEAVLRCAGLTSTSLRVWPNGRAVVIGDVPARCEAASNPMVFPEEQTALTALQRLTNSCLAARSLPNVGAIELDTTSAGAAEGISLRVVGNDNPVTLQALQRTRSCVTTAWVRLNTGLVPPRAYLATSAPNGDQASLAALTTDSLARIATVVIGLVVLSAALVLGVAWSTVRRVRVLQGVTEYLRRGQRTARAPERGRDEIAQLGRAVNALADDLERVQRQRDQFTADIAHDLRTPLTNIRGWIDAWRDGVAPQEGEVMTVVDGEAQHLQRLVDDLQTVANTDAQQLPITHQRFDLAGMVRAAIAARPVSVPLIAYLGPEHLFLDADPGHIRQVLDNLLTNALVHANATQIQVEAIRDTHWVRISVTDNGIGLALEDSEHVFDRLWRADASRGRAPAGNGLGLTVSRKLVELHGGTINVTGTEPHGTVFTVRLPSEVNR